MTDKEKISEVSMKNWIFKVKIDYKKLFYKLLKEYLEKSKEEINA